MKVIQFPKLKHRDAKSQEKTEADLASAKPCDIFNLHDFIIVPENEDQFFEKIILAATEVNAEEEQIASAICSMVDELSRKTSVLKEKYFVPEKSFFKMVGNPMFETKFSEYLNRFPSMKPHKDISLGMVAVMFDRDILTVTEKNIFKFILHLLGTYREINLKTLGAYLDQNDWNAVVSILKDEKS